MAKQFYAETPNAGGTNYLNAYGTPTTVRFDLKRELEVADRIRPLDEQAVTKMVKSLEREGQLKPILIRVWPAKNRTHDRAPRLICGAHRVEAARHLRWTHLTAWFVGCDDDEARQAEIDENLVRKELTAEERGRLYLEWLRLHNGSAAADGDAETMPDQPIIEVVTAPSSPFQDAVNRVHGDPVSEPARPEGGRGKRGGIRELERQTGRSRNAIKRDIAAAQGGWGGGEKEDEAAAASRRSGRLMGCFRGHVQQGSNRRCDLDCEVDPAR